MTIKTDSFKLSPAERLARKRAAARLRQQRCRARKRHAGVVEKSRSETEHRQVRVTHDQNGSVTSSSSIHVASRPRVHEQRTSLGEHHLHCQSQPPSLSLHPHQSSMPIFNCISFDSQRSYEEAQRQSRGGSPPRTFAEPSSSVITPSSSPPRKPSVVSLSSAEKAEEPLVPEEEAAVVAMLSLKTGSEKKENSTLEREREKLPPSPPRVVRVPHHPEPLSTSSSRYRLYHHQPQPQHHRVLEPRRYEVYHEYGPPPQRPHRRTVPAYYRMPAPPMPLPPHYSRGGFYPPPSRYIRYDYE
jgi:hypothetical protein